MNKKVCLSLLLVSLMISMVGCDKEAPDGKGPGATKIEEIQNGGETKKQTTDEKKTEKESNNDKKASTEKKEDTKKETTKTSETTKNENKDENKNTEVEETGNIDNFLFIGDSMMNNLKPVILKDASSAKVYAAGGKEASYFLKRFDSFPEKDVEGVVVWIGVNGIFNESNIDNTTELISKLEDRYPGKKIYVMKVFPVGKNWSYGNKVATEMNPGIEKFNKELESYAKSNNITFIDATKEFIDEDGYLIGSPDDLHLFDSEDNEKILEVIKSSVK